MIAGIAIVNIISVGIFIIPQTIIEFKLSVLLKRIGATNIHPLFFVTAVIIIGVFASIISFLWTLLWGGIYFGGTYGWSVIALPTQIGASIPWIIIILAFLPLCTILILSHKCWEKPIYGLLPTFLNQT
ncbi:hypothetical protein [Spiroplasma endosymbiont of Apeira syringaria]|uniref:hypothetical protein n=1 Tax=Spiroplasma endosymbiont of Apeira syringaria TaxID=3066307 RepID=UPI0030CFFF7C